MVGYYLFWFTKRKCNPFC